MILEGDKQTAGHVLHMAELCQHTSTSLGDTVISSKIANRFVLLSNSEKRTD